MAWSAPVPGSVTVLVVSYRHARFVAECLDSVRAQTRPADRVLVVDDCSPDDSAAVIRDYLDRHPGFAEFFPNEQNLGLNRTLNLNLARIDTEFYTVLAADDFLRCDRLETQLALLAGTDAVLAYSDATVVDADSRVIEESSRIEYPWPDEPGRSERTFAELLDRNWIPAASILVKTAAVRDTGGYPDLLFEDYELLIRLAKRHRFVHTTEPLVSVRRLPTSMMSTMLHGENPRFLTALDAAFRHYEGAEPGLARRALSRRWELAKRAARTSMPRREVVRMMLDARGAARNPLAVAAHLGRALLGRPGVSR